MSSAEEINHKFNDETINLDANKDSVLNDQNFSNSREQIPTFNNILIADDGKDESNKVLNYAISLSRYSGGELLILRILEHIIRWRMFQ